MSQLALLHYLYLPGTVTARLSKFSLRYKKSLAFGRWWVPNSNPGCRLNLHTYFGTNQNVSAATSIRKVNPESWRPDSYFYCVLIIFMYPCFTVLSAVDCSASGSCQFIYDYKSHIKHLHMFCMTKVTGTPQMWCLLPPDLG